MIQGLYDFIKSIFEPLGDYLIASQVPVASSFAGDIDALIALVAVFVGFWAILAYAAFFFLIFRFRDTGQRAQYVTGEEKDLKRWITWPHAAIIACDLVIVFMAIMVWYNIKQRLPEADSTVRIVAQHEGQALPGEFRVSRSKPVIDYFRRFPGLDAGARYNNAGFWELPIPVTTDVDVDPDDVVIYDAERYGRLKQFLIDNGVRHVLLTGYATDMCFCRTTAGYENLSRDFNVFLVGDATLATFPSNASPRFAANAAISFAALNQLITQISWIKLDGIDRDVAER